MPAYREAENLQVLLPKLVVALETLNKPCEILVVDTQEKMDSTDTVCDKFSICTYMNRIGGDQYGDALRTGIKAAAGHYIVVMDADGSHDPADIPRLYAKGLEDYDMVIGSRYIKDGNSHNGVILKAMSWVVNTVYRLVFSIKAKDVSNSFRLYNAEKLKKLTLKCSNFDIVEEIIILFGVLYPDFRLVEVPVYFDRRQHGQSKRSLVKFSFSYIGTIVRMWRLKEAAKKSST